MLPAHIRDQHRARSLRLSQHNRQLALAPSSASPSKTTARVRGHGGAGAASKGSSTAAAKAALEDEVREARGELEHEQPGNSAGADGEQARQQGKETAIEVLLESLVVPSRRSELSCFLLSPTLVASARDSDCYRLNRSLTCCVLDRHCKRLRDHSHQGSHRTGRPRFRNLLITRVRRSICRSRRGRRVGTAGFGRRRRSSEGGETAS